MYRVLLAEDEPDVLEALISLLPWEQYNFHKPRGCRDGQEAAEAVEAGFSPELVIMDINMPRMDGLKLAELLAERLPDATLVILSGYDEFEYARKALKLGVYDYLLKPITPSEMLAALKKYRTEVDRRQALVSSQREEVLRTHFLTQLISERPDESSIAASCTACGLTLDGPRYLSCVADVDVPAPSSAADRRTLDLSRYGLYNIASELAAEETGLFCFQGREGRASMIFQGKAPSEAAERFLLKLRPLARQALHTSVSAGLGNEYGSPAELHRSHDEALEALQYRRFYPGGAALRYAKLEARSSDFDIHPWETSLLECLSTLNRVQAEQTLQEMLAAMNTRKPPFEVCLRVAQRLLVRVWQRVSELTGASEAGKWERESEALTEQSVADLEALGRALRGILDRAFEALSKSREDLPTSQVMRATAYIRENYARSDLSLSDLTELLAVSTSYFSSIFKQKTGRTFVEYLTMVRMEEAKRILAYTDRRAYEVAENVGFADPHYFSNAFKKATGMTPVEYREAARGSTEVSGE